ncbi:hypothetical protein BC830DRAFT_1155188 [Chytriomyces sp. MP71]|nr:hypothetical protein BC830DRAFT_1155188 [Chytriomyces sp. MP71]
MSKRSATQQREEQPDVEPEGGQVGRLGGRDETEGVPDSIEKRQSKLASAMARILGDVAENKAEQQKQEGNESAKKAKRSRKVDEKPILSKHKNIEAQIDDQKLEDKAKKQISRERKLKALDVARVKPDDFVFANDLEKKLKKIATKGGS